MRRTNPRLQLEAQRHATLEARRFRRRVATPTGRVDWFVSFAERDLVRATVAELRRLHGELVSLIDWEIDSRRERGGGIVLLHAARLRRRFSVKEVKAVQATLRPCLEALLARRVFDCATPAGTWHFYRSTDTIERYLDGFDVGQATLFAMIGDLNKIGADRLRACPFAPSGSEPCGRVFVARHKKKKFCSSEHAQRAAWHRWYPEHAQERKEARARS